MQLPIRLTNDDFEASATIRDLGNLDRVLEYVEERSRGERMDRLLDVGCGLGGLTLYVGQLLGITQFSGIDRDPERLAVARERGIRALELDVERERFPFEDGSQDVVCSFGMFEHIVYYDHPLAESSRILRPGGWLLVAMPNLGSYLNRASLLIGAQPRNVEISKEVPAGILRGYKGRVKDGKPLGHVHSATLAAMKEVIEHHGFRVELVRSSSPDFGSRLLRVADATLGRVPSLARRYIIVARKRGAVVTSLHDATR